MHSAIKLVHSQKFLRDTEKNNTDACKPVTCPILIFLITPTLTICRLSLTPQIAAKISNKNYSSFNWVHSIHMGWMSASLSTNLFANLYHDISTNGKAPPHSHVNLQHPSIPLFTQTKGKGSKCQLSKLFTVVIQPLSIHLIKPYFCFTLPPTQNHSFFPKNSQWQTSVAKLYVLYATPTL